MSETLRERGYVGDTGRECGGCDAAVQLSERWRTLEATETIVAVRRMLVDPVDWIGRAARGALESIQGSGVHP